METSRSVGLVILSVLALAAGLAGCTRTLVDQSVPERDVQDPADPDPEPVPVSFDVLLSATTPASGITERSRRVIRGRDTWEAYWTQLMANLAPTPSPPAVDFTQTMVIAATMGSKPTGGYLIEIKEIVQTGNDLQVTVKESSPGPSCVTIQVLTAPAVAVLVPRTEGSVEFVEKTATVDCR
jgi:hypothetical protein